MTKTTFAQNWHPMRPHFQAWWGELTEADMERASGSLDRFLMLLQLRCGYTRVQAEAELLQRVTAYERN